MTQDIAEGSACDNSDLERIIGVLDEAIMSDDPRIQECLRRLMVTVALIEPDRSNRQSGPLAILFRDVDTLRQRISSLEHSMQNKYYTGSPTPSWTTTYNSTALDPVIGKWLNGQ